MKSNKSISLMLISKRAHRRIQLISCTFGFVVALMSNQEGSANGWIFYAEECGGKDAIEYRHSRMLEPCESEKLMIELDKRVGAPCTAEMEACIDDRILNFGVSHEDAESFCVNQPTSLDPSFKGSCPLHLEKFESTSYNGDEWLLERVYVRLGFNKLSEVGDRVFRQRDSARRLRKLLESEPNNLVALEILSVLYEENGIVETIKLEIKRYERERDCRQHWSWLPRMLYSHFEELAENWMGGKGTGSELNEKEIHDLVQQARVMLIDMYDNAIDKSDGISKFDYALGSIREPLLSGNYSSIKQIADRVGINMEGYAEKRRTTLKRQLAREYGVEAAYGPKETLGMMCNDSAFEIGLEEHCLDLLEHYSTKIDLYDESLGRDWAQAATLLVNRLTSDCSEPLDSISNDGRCIADRHVAFTTRIKAMLSDIPQQPLNAERELLEAYLHMDETSDEFFIRSLALDASKVEYAENVGRRLHRRGKSDTAFKILKASIEAHHQSKPDVHEPYDTNHGNSQTVSKSQVRLLRMESVLKSVNEGQYHNCKESYKYAPWMEDALSETSEAP